MVNFVVYGIGGLSGKRRRDGIGDADADAGEDGDKLAEYGQCQGENLSLCRNLAYWN